MDSAVLHPEVIEGINKMKTAYGQTIKAANRAGYFRIIWMLPPGAGRYGTSITEKVVDRKTAMNFANRHGIQMPNI